MAIGLQHPQPASKRRSVLGRLFRPIGWLAAGPLDWMGIHRIKRSASFIRDLAVLLRSSPRPDAGFKSSAAGDFDLEATAACYELSVVELQAHLAARQRQTALIAYTAFALAWVFLLSWLWQALSLPWSAARLWSMLSFLPFCVLFLLLAFYNALLNFQIRTGRTASWREYLGTAEPFWPR